MKVKVGNKIYDGEKEPVMVILSEQDRENINHMSPECTKYCCFPKAQVDGILDWMEAPEELEEPLRCMYCEKELMPNEAIILCKSCTE